MFSKTGILPSTGGSSGFTTAAAADFSEGGSGARGSRSAKGGSGFLYDRCSLCIFHLLWEYDHHYKFWDIFELFLLCSLGLSR